MTDDPTSSLPPPEKVDHAWIHERLAAGVAGGLTTPEQSLFDAHINTCPVCFDAFTDARDADRSLQRTLSPLAPSDHFEETLVHIVREKIMHKRFPVVVKRASIGIAAAVALAATGVFASHVVRQDTLNNPLSERLAASAGDDVLLSKWARAHELANRTHLGELHTLTDIMGLEIASSDREPTTQPFGSVERRSSAGRFLARVTEKVDMVEGDRGGQVEDHLWYQQSDKNVDSGLESHRKGGRDGEGKDEKKSGSGALTLGGVSNFSGGTTVMNGNMILNGGGAVLNVNVAGKNEIETLDLNGPSGTPLDVHFYGGSLAGGKADYYKPLGTVSKNGDYGISSTSRSLTLEDGRIRDRAAVGQKVDNASKASSKDYSTYSFDRDKNDENARAAQKTEAEALKYKASVTALATSGDQLAARPYDYPNKGTSAPASVPVSVAATAPGAASPPAAQAPEMAMRKIIRNGIVEFEVRSFDDAYNTISEVTLEEKGYVSSTSSDKLANGKIRGSVVVRVPPERLDRLLMKLRALGELKSQQISASDVTKQYTDIESELRALRAMEERLLDLVKNGKGEVKDLVIAEKQLGEYRVRIEKLEGEIRYYNNLVGMATLTITAYEKDIQTPTAASEMELVGLSMETEDVETKYRDARQILQEAKGRIVESELKKLDAEQLSARIVVDVPPDKAEFVAAQLKQLGKVTTFNRDRRQTTTGGTGVPTVQVEQKDTRFTIVLFNLANIAPRETAVLTIAVRDVEASYRKILGLVRKPVPAAPKSTDIDSKIPMQPAGRVVTSNINGQQPEQMTADVRADVRAEEADAMLQAIRDTGEVLTSTSSENPDTSNVTSAKRGIQLRLVNMAAVPARESQALRIVAANVPDAYGKLVGALQAQGAANVRIINSQLKESDPRTVSASISFEARRESLPAVEKAFADAGVDFLSRSIVRSSDTTNTLDSKVRFQIDELVAAESLPPRRTTVLGIEIDSVEKSLDTFRGFLPAESAKELEYNLSKETSGRVTGHLVMDVPVTNAMSVLAHLKDLGGLEKVNQVVKNSQVPDTRFARERIEVTLTSREAILDRDKGVGNTVRAALANSAAALLFSLNMVITGVLFIGPWLLIGWVLWKVLRRRKATA